MVFLIKQNRNDVARKFTLIKFRRIIKFHINEKLTKRKYIFYIKYKRLLRNFNIQTFNYIQRLNV